MRRITLIVCVLSALMLGGCVTVRVNMPSSGVDYADKGNWAYYGVGDDKDADLFLIAPTVDVKDEYNMSIDDEERCVVKVPDVEAADFPAYVPGLPEGAYHVYDYQFFYRNLQENVKERVDSYAVSDNQG